MKKIIEKHDTIITALAIVIIVSIVWILSYSALNVQASDSKYSYYVYTYVSSPDSAGITGEVKSFKYLGMTTENSIMADRTMYIILEGSTEVSEMSTGSHIYIFEEKLSDNLAYQY